MKTTMLTTFARSLGINSVNINPVKSIRVLTISHDLILVQWECFPQPGNQLPYTLCKLRADWWAGFLKLPVHTRYA